MLKVSLKPDFKIIKLFFLILLAIESINLNFLFLTILFSTQIKRYQIIT